ncbi:tautomerase family protein [Actinomadura sp. 7K507]|uniref:tautomerase family protein n=1 Tax=Actinomadura sp. 7K507 TaxID=2530365 RepID=UPI00104DA1B1|nr:tautomerase family protein [Actinomadura sp. 7K507]TDC98455.1 4-oxalocrotonate tautomerase family protein [Actinomadura sp. 7K507]
MPLVQISLAAGRPPGQIRDLISEVHDAVVRATGTDPARVRVLVQEIPPAHWAAGGVTLAERDASRPAGTAGAGTAGTGTAGTGTAGTEAPDTAHTAHTPGTEE